MKKTAIKSIYFLLLLVFTGCDYLDKAYNMLSDNVIPEPQIQKWEQAPTQSRQFLSLSIEELPLKVIYQIGDTFSTDGIIVKAKYSSSQNTVEDVTNSVIYFTSNSLTGNETIVPDKTIFNVATDNLNIYVSYSEMGITKTSSYTVSVLENFIKVEDIYFNNSEIEIGRGNSKQLNVTIIPEDASQKKVLWKSSDPSIVSINSEGIITAIKEGTVTITATSVDNLDIQATCTVVSTYQQPEEVIIYQEDLPLNLEVLKTCQLTASILPELAPQQVIWSSDNEKLATVDDAGLVTAYKNTGTVGITAASTDNPQIKTVCNINIFKYDVESIVINKNEVEIFVDHTVSLADAVSVFPENASFPQYTWSSSNVNIAKVSKDGLITAVNRGQAVITATSVDNPEVKAECTVTVTEISELEPQDYKIGDLILKDGTFVKYNSISNMTSEQKSKAVAVIFGYKQVETEEGNQTYALGAGLYRGSNLAWCEYDSPGYSIDFKELYSSYSNDIIYDTNGNSISITTFTGNTDGSDDWDYIRSLDQEGTNNPSQNYPAWNYVINYGENKKLKGFYKKDWYMPSMKEIYKLSANLTAVNTAITYAGGYQLYNNSSCYFLTSCPRSTNDIYCYYIYNNSGNWDTYYKNSSYSYIYIVPVKAFPCSVEHNDDEYESKSVSVSYPSYSEGNLSVNSETDDNGNYTFTISESSSEGKTYQWFLDSTLLDSNISEDGSVLSLSKEYLMSLVSGNHEITVIQQAPDNNFYDAQCYITVLDGIESTFKPEDRTNTIILPVFTESTLSIDSRNNSGGYTFTAIDESRSYTSYSWFLDETLLTQTGNTMTLNPDEIEVLALGAHLISVLAKTADGTYYDAQCYIKKYEDLELP